ncbi:MAG TPA: nickel pincer cofactor biosynthesis protein LarB [Spirochaetia bacterium]
MNRETLRDLLERVRSGETAPADALEELRDFPAKELSYATLDTQRELRVGYPEVVYCEGKTSEQVRGIFESLLAGESPILGTRADETRFEAVRDLSPDLRYDPVSRTITLRRGAPSVPVGRAIAVVTAGTSDIPVAEEAAVTAEVFGARVERVFDVGVAGLHRVLGRLDVLRAARAIVVAAGMEGALASVVAGLVEAPVIAVPTSVGYGACFHGLSALLSMLTSCAAGVAVVNIDNGFGAGYMASMIARR